MGETENQLQILLYHRGGEIPGGATREVEGAKEDGDEKRSSLA